MIPPEISVISAKSAKSMKQHNTDKIEIAESENERNFR